MKTTAMKFGLRTMLVVVAIVALMMVAVPAFLDWFTNPPSVPLSKVVSQFNESTGTPNALKGITEDEIVTAIDSQLPTLVEAERVKQVLRRITQKQRVPPDTTIECTLVSSPELSGQKYMATNLCFEAHTGLKYGILVRSQPHAE